jgi:hypothetical protein
MRIWRNAFDNGSTDDGPDAQIHPLQMTVMKMSLPDRKGVLS